MYLSDSEENFLQEDWKRKIQYKHQTLLTKKNKNKETNIAYYYNGQKETNITHYYNGCPKLANKKMNFKVD